jgi:murein DD-endopeptidase MepM/ murein hydrolase activator NlpD
MGVDKSSPLYSTFANNTAQAGLLAATEQGQVGGYDTALNTNASLTNDLTGVATAAQGVTNALMGLKGFLETFPQAGGVGGTIGGLASTATSLGTDYMMNRSLKKSITSALTNGVEQIGPLLANGAFVKNAGKDVGILSKIGNWFKGLLPAVETAGEDALAVASVGGGPFDHGSMGHGGIGGPTSGKSILPVPKGTPVTSPYGQRGGGAKTKGFHAGIDYDVQTGSNVYAHEDGVVTIVGNGGGYGNYIEIDHGSYRTRYAHLSSIMVSRGQKVTGGQVIAKSGATGNVTGPHLHFEVLVNGKKVNPAPYLVGSSGSTSSAGMSSSSRNLSGNTGSIDLGSLSSTDVNSVLNSLNSNAYSNLSSIFGSSGARNLNGNSSMSFIKGQLQNTKGLILGTGSQQTWAKTLLGKLGKPITADNIKALTTWAAWEGGQWKNSAHYNPLNTTENEPGATNMNSEGVKSYTSWGQGYAATVSTLNNGRYKSILKALSAGNNASSVLHAVDHSPWGTHIPGYGGPTGDLGTAGVADHIPTVSSGRGGPMGGGGSGSPVNVNFNVKFYAQQASVADAKRFIKMIEDEAKKSSLLKTIGSVG